MRRGTTPRRCLLWALLLLPLAAMADADLDELERLVGNGRFAEAHALAKKWPSRLGDPRFDFLYGLAAIEEGRYPEGVLALERHLAARPGNDRARLDLAKGYFELGDYTRARQEFEFVLAYQPPPAVRDNIARYLNAMETRQALATRNSSRGYLELGAGSDSNANAGTHHREIELPFGPVRISDEDSRSVPSDFLALAAGGQWARRVSPELAAFAGADLDGKFNADARRFDTGNVSAHVGFSSVSGARLLRLTLTDALMTVDGHKYRATLALAGEWQHGIGQGLFLTGVAQHAEQAYTGNNAIRDSRTRSVGAGLQKSFSGPWAPAAGAMFFWAKETNINQREDLGRTMTTARTQFTLNPSGALSLGVGLTLQASRFAAPDLAFLTVREDRLVAAEINASYALSRRWSCRAEWQTTDNRSNQDLYDFDRRWLALKTRFSF